ncbi:DUF6882 domain-containing protein [Nocardiopsis sp. NPDC006139]|uniref:DUF6882 domain-containing protein n=1 Tax=Nocardiopsis sp. NPDC006139 TaxID=3154578 RepID=UPI0033BC2D62
MSPFYSREFHDLARPHLGWVLEQYNLFDELVPNGDVNVDFAACTVRRGGYELRVGLLGSYAEDGTWLWGWANPHFEGAPVIAETERLRTLGAAGPGVPELAEGLVDLNHLPDPRLGSDHLALAAMGLLGARGLVIFNHGGRARTFLVVTDPGIPFARPGAADRVEACLRNGSLLFGDSAWDGERGYATAVVRGYLAHHGLTERVGEGGIGGVFDNGNVLTVRIGADDTLDGVEITGPDGGEPLPGPTVAATGLRRTDAGPQPEPFPSGLLPTVLPRLARALAQDLALEDHLREAGWSAGAGVEWDADTATLRYPTAAEGPGAVVVAGREIGVFDPATATWEWAGWEGAEPLRAAAGDSGHPELAADGVDLSGYRRPAHIVDILTRTAAGLGSGRGVATVPADGGRTRYVVVTDPAVPAARADLERVAEVILGAANLVHPVASRESLRRDMRALARGYFEAFGLPTLNMYGPEALGGLFGLYEARVLFSVDGTVQSVEVGLMGAPR